MSSTCTCATDTANKQYPLCDSCRGKVAAVADACKQEARQQGYVACHSCLDRDRIASNEKIFPCAVCPNNCGWIHPEQRPADYSYSCPRCYDSNIVTLPLDLKEDKEQNSSARVPCPICRSSESYEFAFAKVLQKRPKSSVPKHEKKERNKRKQWVCCISARSGLLSFHWTQNLQMSHFSNCQSKRKRTKHTVSCFLFHGEIQWTVPFPKKEDVL